MFRNAIHWRALHAVIHDGHGIVRQRGKRLGRAGDKYGGLCRWRLAMMVGHGLSESTSANQGGNGERGQASKVQGTVH
jgi:hypothetical protein